MSFGTHSVVVLTLALILTGCGHSVIDRPSLQADLPSLQANLPSDDRSILAGEWEYEESASTISLLLDEQGNGTYTWKDGRFETTQFGNHVWVGNWYQKENDRNGGFIVKLSPDYTEGEGTWWYSRIGSDAAPLEKGGTFHLSRKTSLTNLSETPPAP